MRVSQFEIYRLVQRALEGSGAPYGVDRDGAQAVAWLESRGLPGLSLLQEDLPLIEGRFTGLALTQNPGSLEIDAAGTSAIAYGSAVIDLARDGATLRLHRCRRPLFLLPPAVAAGRPIQLRWRDILCGVDADAGALLWGGDGEALLDSTPTEVEIRAGAATPAERPFLDPAELARRYANSLARGVEVDDGIWRRIDAVAARVQVPASVESRLKGAGGGVRERLTIPAARAGGRRRSTCWRSRQAIVIGPTPPGTGVMAPATATAPRRRRRRRPAASCRPSAPACG